MEDGKGTERWPLSCCDLEAEGLTMKNVRPAHCCSSCHYDADKYDYELQTFQMEDGRWVEVCCYVASDLERI